MDWAYVGPVFRTGLWTIGRWRGVPIRLHWSIPLGALFFGHFEFVPGFWLGFVLLVLFHELGHAYLAHRRRLGVLEVQVHGLGGVCVSSCGAGASRVSLRGAGASRVFFCEAAAPCVPDPRPQPGALTTPSTTNTRQVWASRFIAALIIRATDPRVQHDQ